FRPVAAWRVLSEAYKTRAQNRRPDKAFYAASGIQCLMRRWRVLSGHKIQALNRRPDKAFTPHPAFSA
ncbi:hypothetical protein, partial [Escherichia coli]|uniref:hypothetical protein n=1 Tax=Escherichia coli TaxID=562 RepID=UPI001A7E66B8